MRLSEMDSGRADRMITNLNITKEDCYGLFYDEAEVIAYWNGGRFRIFRLDDVGKFK